MKNQKGVTLVSLVVTIIVLLILAGISVAMLTGDNGILTQANSAKKKTDTSKNEEIIKLIYNAAKLKFTAPSEDDKGKSLLQLSKEEAESSFKEYNITINEIDSTTTKNYIYKFGNSEIEYNLDSSGNIKQDDGSLTLESLFRSKAYPGESTATGTITQTAGGFIADIQNCR